MNKCQAKESLLEKYYYIAKNMVDHFDSLYAKEYE